MADENVDTASEPRRRASSRSPPVRLMREDREVRRPPFLEKAYSPPASPRSSVSVDRRASPLRQCMTTSTGGDECESLSGTNSNSNDTSDSSELDCTTTTTTTTSAAPNDKDDEQATACAVL